jgi:hypothetical protein
MSLEACSRLGLDIVRTYRQGQLCVISTASKWLAELDGKSLPCMDVLVILDVIFLWALLVFSETYIRVCS